MVRQIIKIGISIAVLISLIGCNTLVRIESEPPGADVYINEQYIGETPVEKSLSDFVGNDYRVRLELEGHQEIRTELEKEVKADVLIIGLFLLCVPLLWVYGPEEYHYYKLKPETNENVSVIINHRSDLIVFVDNREIGIGVHHVPTGMYTFSVKYKNNHYKGITAITKANMIYEIN